MIKILTFLFIKQIGFFVIEFIAFVITEIFHELSRRVADAQALDALRCQCDAIEAELLPLRWIYDDHAGLQDRFIGTGTATPDLARRLGLTGLAGRASGQAAVTGPWPGMTRSALKTRNFSSS